MHLSRLETLTPDDETAAEALPFELRVVTEKVRALHMHEAKVRPLRKKIAREASRASLMELMGMLASAADEEQYLKEKYLYRKKSADYLVRCLRGDIAVAAPANLIFPGDTETQFSKSNQTLLVSGRLENIDYNAATILLRRSDTFTKIQYATFADQNQFTPPDLSSPIQFDLTGTYQDNRYDSY